LLITTYQEVNDRAPIEFMLQWRKWASR